MKRPSTRQIIERRGKREVLAEPAKRVCFSCGDRFWTKKSHHNYCSFACFQETVKLHKKYDGGAE